MRQGSPLSPFLFNVYFDDVLARLQKVNWGCKYRGIILHVLAYADDMVLMSPSWEGMQNLINVAHEELNCLELEVNVKKTMCMRVCPVRAADCFLHDIPCFTLNGATWHFVISLNT